MKDTKLISNFCILKATGPNASIKTRRIRADECHLETLQGDITIGSYVEATKLKILTQDGSVTIHKKLGLGEKGLIETGRGMLNLSAIYSNIANMPPKEQ